METLEYLIAANFSFTVHGGLKWDEKIDKNDIHPKLIKRAIFSKKSFDECAETLMELRSITCLGREYIALQMIQKQKITLDQSKISILKEHTILTNRVSSKLHVLLWNMLSVISRMLGTF